MADLTPNARAVLAALATADPVATAGEIAQATGLARSTVTRHLDALTSLGLARVGGYGPRCWWITGAGREEVGRG